ncbi:MAG: hypothetical protein JSV77_01460 [Dehalococcoidales bacterium]|nr:MAG: hypothetical protein JSV77_01460 [Dehalococcoidales bacterium]
MMKRKAISTIWTLVLTLVLIIISTGVANAFITETEKLTASDGVSYDDFGYSVAISGDTTVVGAPYDDSASGSAYVFVSSASGWSQEAKLTASDRTNSDYFGYSVAISGDTIVVGAYGDDSRTGSAYVFEKPITGWADMTETEKLTATDGAPYDYFGFSVAISGDTTVVGAHGDDDDGSSSGSAYIFVSSASGWSQQAKLTASDGASYDGFGYSVSISGDTAVIGAIYDDDKGSSSGSAYVFEKPATGWTDMTETEKLAASDGASYDFFGYYVSISGDTAVVGAPDDDDNGDNSGSAYVFVNSASGWSQQAKLTASDGASYDEFGYSVSISGDTIVVGAYGDDDNGSYSGSAYIFQKPILGWTGMTETEKLIASDATDYDFFGISVSISGYTAVVGADGDNGVGLWRGSAYVFVIVPPNSPPVIDSVNADPDILWPPNHKPVDVTITVVATDPDGAEDIDKITYSVLDEYGVYNVPETDIPEDGIISLIAERNGDDQDGRLYIITIIVYDFGGMTDTTTIEIVVPHDNGMN